MGNVVAPKLPGMPEPYVLSRFSSGGETVITRGPYVVGRYENDDRGLRNLLIVSLTDAGHSGKEVAACFSLTPQYVSMLRGRAKAAGSAGIVRPMGRPSTFSPARVAKAKALRAAGCSDSEIARRLGVHSGTIGRLFARLGTTERVAEQRLPIDPEEGAGLEEDTPEPGAPESPSAQEPTTKIGNGTSPTRYAGAMLLWPFFARVGLSDVLGGLPSGPARRYDATTLVTAATFGFALGSSSAEGTKHLVANDAGVVLGRERFPHLRTLRPRLSELAESCDPFALQRAFAKAMLDTDDAPPEVFYVDDHFVTYWGKRPVQKGYNVRRHLAEPGRDDTFVVDQSWRAIVFSSGAPRGLSVTLPEILGELRSVTGDRRVVVGFDRGGSYPVVFSAIKATDMEWITWRRAPLAVSATPPKRVVVAVGDTTREYLIADEAITLSGYEGPVRQLSAYEEDKIVFQILTSDTTLDPAATIHRLRSRWRIENANKYFEDHQGVHWLCSYAMDTEENTAQVTNPARREGRAVLRAAQVALADAERALGRAVEGRVMIVDEHLAEIGRLRNATAIASDEVASAKAALRAVPAKLPANVAHPGAVRAKPRLATRALQMVCRLLAYNAELDLARHLDAYLGDPDEYRAITANLLHLGGHVAYEPKRITVTLDRPGAPRVASALSRLIEELNACPPHLPGDRRPITYQVAGS